MVTEADMDVVVIGSGVAGLAAASTALEAGCTRVMIAESEDVVGGSSRLSGGVVMGSGSRFQAAAGITDNVDDLFHDYMQLNQWDVEVGAVGAFTRRTGETIDWLAAHGVAFCDRLIFGGDESKPRSHCVEGGGKAIVDTLLKACRADGVDIALGRRVDRLLINDGRVTGVAVGDDEITAHAVVVASGGFGANNELLAEYFPSAWREGWTWYIGADGARGDAFGFAGQVGAQITGRDRGLRTLDPNLARLNEAFLPGWTVLLDTRGRRFCDETAPYGIMDGLVRARDDVAYVVFDDAALRPPEDLAERYRDAYKQVWPNHPPFRPKNYTADLMDEMSAKGKVSKADSVAELAKALELDETELVGEIARYNEHVEVGEDRDFGKAARFLLPLGTAPYYAVQVRPTTVNLTGCGLRIDAGARVLGTDARPIGGLYAAGECTGGVIGTRYMGSGNGLASASTVGRIAGESAARHALTLSTVE